ncbi:MAG: metallophosphoesterase [Fuscovulum sp.]|nr:MAG: metallophosphoesterase [Fuscovulum sp.]
MPALIVADLHLDFWLAKKRDPFENMEAGLLDCVDALILAGDVTNKGHVQWRHALRWLSERVDLGKVHLFPGNHDYYGGRIDRDDKLAAICREAGANFAQKAEVIVGSDRYLCATLWTDMKWGANGVQFHRHAVEGKMNDFRSIRIEAAGFRKLYPAYAASVHHDHLRWIEDRLNAPFEGRSFIVTHHAPLPVCCTKPEEDIACAYVSDLSEFIRKKKASGCLDGWIHGHTHFQGPSDFEGVPILCASLGYPIEHRVTPSVFGILV